MNKIISKLKGKKVLSFVLAAVMLATTFSIALPMLKLDASAAGSITTTDGETVTQTKILDEAKRYTTYDKYASQYLNGASNPTNIVVPGLQNSEDYVIQGMSYYPAKDWMLITSYHGDSDETGTVKSSKVFAIDAATGEFVAMFDFYNPGTTTLNTEHGGGIAISEHNLYYACGDDDREIAYAPLSELELAPGQTYKTIQLVASADFNEIGSVTYDGKTGYTAYVCFDEGVLWTGNFYDEGVELVGGLDFTEIANGYNAPANNDYNSMVFGYRLAGNSPTEEWNNLMGALGKDCRGTPSYVIGIDNAIKDVQYAVVDNGKLYLSCSYGTGEGTLSVSYAGMNPYSTLVVADIDLSQPGTKSTNIVTHEGQKTVKAYDIQKYTTFDMMPMSEGLCIVNDNIFITFESASYKYREKAGVMGNCGYPVDVVWQLDPYELMETTVAEPDKSIYYEKVTSLSEIENGKEYIIVHKSQREDPVSQKNYLYAIDADGNFNGYKLSKSTTESVNGYNGMIGHPISYYSFDTTADGKEILYLDNPDEDDIESIRWKITKASDGSYRFENTETYFANCNYLFFNDQKISMAPGNADYLKELTIMEAATEPDNVKLGGFWLGNGNRFLWCNDGTSDFYNDKINSYYSSNSAMYPGVTEVPGTMHCDATNSSGANILGKPILTGGDTGYEDGVFYIYKRVVDEEASTYESRVYTNLDSKLQADGTYTVTLDTYAISPNHYQYVGERPTDYIIVADTSKTMDITEAEDPSLGSTGIAPFNGSLSVDSLSQDDDTSDNKGKGVVGYGFYQPGEDIYFKHTDGKYYKAYMAICNYTEMTVISGRRQFYFVYYIADDGLYYCVVNQAFETDENGNRKGITYSEFKARVDNANDIYAATEDGSQVKFSEYSTQGTNGNRKKQAVYSGEHYRFDNITSTYTKEHQSIDALKTTANDLVDKIAEQNPQNRIALVQYGASNGYYNTSGSRVSSGYTDAFWSTTNKETLKTKINGLTAGLETSNSSIMMDYVSNIISNSGEDYKSGGDRNVAVILLSDGVPGKETEEKVGAIFGIGGHPEIKTTETDAKNTANEIISKARAIKANGAFIYTVLLGNTSAGSFAKKTYMDAVSSKYPAATKMDNLGGQSTDGINYALNIATCSMNNFVNFGSIACEEVARNNAVGLDNLNGESYIRAVLNDTFIIPANYGIKAQLVPGTYDEIGRFSFDEAKDTDAIKPNFDKDTKTITATGYDYSTQYISRGNPGQALRIIITGLLANGTIDNSLVTNIDTTAIYKTKDDMNTSTNESNDLSFKKFPIDRENIPEYTYVLDYGLDMLDVDVNGTMLALDKGYNQQPKDSNGNILYRNETAGDLIEMADSNQNLVYKVTPTSIGDEGYILIDREDGTYDWFKINVVPASNVYFEETEFATTEGTGIVAWGETTGGTSVTHRDVPKELDVDGYDEAYNNTNTYSNGKTLSATVNATNKRSKTATVTFVGDGIDIISACGQTTGIQIINIKDTSTGKSVKAGIVDTYYSGGSFTQVPVFSWRGAPGTYIVESTAVYLSTAGALLSGTQPATYANKSADAELVKNSSTAFDTSAVQQILDEAGFEDISAEDVELIWHDDNSILNGGTGALPVFKGTSELKMSAGDAAITKGVASGEGGLNNYLDGFRIYNPIGTNSNKYVESEKYASYVNVINNLAPVGDGKDNLDGIGFITGTLGDGEKLTFSNYKSLGPKDEFYLLNNQTVTFNTKVNVGEKVMLGLRAVNGPTTVIITSNKTGENVEITVNSATEMFYDISNCIGDIAEDNTVVQVIVQNTGAEGKMLAVNQVKFSGGTKVNTGNGGISAVNDPVFLSLTPAALTEVEISLTEKETVQGEVKNGVIVPDTEEIPEDNTNTDTDNTNPDNENTNPDNENTNPDNENTNDGTDTEGSEEEFDISSLIRMFIKMIETIIKTAIGGGSIA